MLLSLSALSLLLVADCVELAGVKKNKNKKKSQDIASPSCRNYKCSGGNLRVQEWGGDAVKLYVTVGI